jgi:ParB-like nuclease domain
MNKIATLESSSRLVVTYRPVGDLIPDPRNARTHPKRQIDQIRKSIEAFGFTNPILADPEGHVIAGHGRLQAARLMGLAELPVITLSGLSDTQKRMLRIADNKIAVNAGWGLEILQLELGELGAIDVDVDLTLTGYSTGEIDVILTSAVDPDDEVIPSVPLAARTKLGGIWILFVVEAIRTLQQDRDFALLLQAEHLALMPAFLEERLCDSCPSVLSRKFVA